MAAALYRQPVLGLVAFSVAFLSQWLGHSLWTFIREVFGTWHNGASFLVGLGGAALIGAGLRRDEVSATWMGFLGAQFVWVGWFELMFEFYSEFFRFPEYDTGVPGLIAAPAVTFLMSTLPVMLMMFLFYGFYNRETKCNLMRWVHRTVGLSPGMPGNNSGRSYARIVALETLFVVWFCYLFWLYVSYLLASETAMLVAYGVWATWFAYIFYKLLKYPRAGSAFRYAIPVGIIGWGLMEMPSYLGFYPEMWLKPFDYPVTTLFVSAIYAGGLVYLANPPGGSPSADGAVPA
ncbi:MAG: hypothetical protein FJ197_00580 [Gammaproteobacteria bacterium]|nr:hypothetical protein [Gammaproteobacteria bacterium]